MAWLWSRPDADENSVVGVVLNGEGGDPAIRQSLDRAADEAQAALDESRAVADRTSQHAYDSEHRRLEAEVLLAQGDVEGTERVYLESLEIARSQGARWLELRASRGYASYLLGVGRPDEARTALRICDSITEGRETHDFVYAEALLRTL